MTLRLHKLILYSDSGTTRTVSFSEGVNIITGRSGTGKSALIDIVDYCLGRSTFTVPEGVIREHVAWYAIIFQLNEFQILIAKPRPKSGAESQTSVHYEVGANIVIPELGQLSADTNDAAVRLSISGFLGFSGEPADLPDGSTRSAYEVNVRHAAHYLYQPQSIIANRETLFYRQQEDWATQTIRDTLPFFLGAITEDRLRLLEELRAARRELSIRAREREEWRVTVTEGLRMGRSLLQEAQQAGILEEAHQQVSDEDVVAILKKLTEWTPSVPSTSAESRLPELRSRRESIVAERLRIEEMLTAAQAFAHSAGGFSGEANEQLRRLESVELFDIDPSHCLVCGTELDGEIPTVAEIRDGFSRLQADLAQVESERPRLREYIASMRSQRDRLRSDAEALEFRIQALVAELDAARRLRDQTARSARVIGRISLYLESTSGREVGPDAESAYEQAKARVDALENELDETDVQALQESYLNRIGRDMTAWAASLPFEHKDWPLRLDPKRVTVVADRPGRPFPMSRMGSAQNFLTCHLATLFALHGHFQAERRPVPGFLILDQPSQVYFPSREEYDRLSGSIADTSRVGVDLELVRNLFATIFHAAESIGRGFQIIILEHANLDDPRFQEALVEDPWYDEGLVPSQWYS